MMKKATTVLLLLLAAVTPAFAQETILHMSGNSWETGAFPPSNLGDELQAVGILNDIEAPLVWDTANYSYTWYVRDLSSLGEVIVGTTRVVTYEIYRQSFQNLRLGLGAAEAYLLTAVVILITIVYVKILYRRENREARQAREAAA